MAAFVWKNIENVENIDDLVAMVLDEYEVEENVARNDISEFVEQLKKVDMID